MKVTTQSITDRIDTESHQRAVDAVDDENALVESTDLDRHYRVMLPNSSQGVHQTMIAVDRWGQLSADCDCAHITHGDGPCAHILTLLLSWQQGAATIDGQPIKPATRHGDLDDDHPLDAVDLTNDEDEDDHEDEAIDPNVDPDPVEIDDEAVETGDGITVDGGIDTDDNWSDRL